MNKISGKDGIDCLIEDYLQKYFSFQNDIQINESTVKK